MKFAHSLLAALGGASIGKALSIETFPPSDPTDDRVDGFQRYLGNNVYSTRFADVYWNDETWTLTTSNVALTDYHAQQFVANGYIGLSTAANGPFVQQFNETAGWPLFDQRQTFGTVSNFFDSQPRTNGTNFPWLYQYGGDSVISGIPAWGPIIIDLGNGTYLDASTSVAELSDVKLVQDYRRGVAKWMYIWTPSSIANLTLQVSYEMFASKIDVNRAFVQLNVTASRQVTAEIVNVLDGFNALRSAFAEKGTEANDVLYTAVKPNGIDNVTAWVYSKLDIQSSSTPVIVTNRPYAHDFPSTIAQAYNVTLSAGCRFTATKYVGVASSDGFQYPQAQARNAVTYGLSDGYQVSLSKHVVEWHRIMPSTSVASFRDPTTNLLPPRPLIIEKAITTVVSTFMLLMNTVSEAALQNVEGAPIDVAGISVGGLTSDAYAGWRFWDQDFWMQPYLAAVHPFEARQISNLRAASYPQALENIKTNYQSSKANYTFSSDAAIYPWVAGRYSRCGAPGPCFDYEYHLNGDIVRAFVVLWSASGNSAFFEQNLYKPTMSIAQMYSEVLTSNGNLLNMTDPDEYANFVDDGGFTMPLIKKTFEAANFFKTLFGQEVNEQWVNANSLIQIPESGDLSLEYLGMNGSIQVKQADVVLKIYPLMYQENYTLPQALADLDYYAGKQSTDGPGMTYAIFSIDAADLSPSGCSSFTYDVNSWAPYARGPWYSFSEQLVDNYDLNGGTNPAYPFLTGHGGFLQVDLFGYLGLRYDIGFTLRLDPLLPPQIPHIRYPIFYFQGWPMQAVANQTYTTVTRLSTPLSGANMTFANTAFDVSIGYDGRDTYTIPPNGTLVIPNKQQAANLTIPDNLLQCQTHVSSPDNYEPGQFPFGAVDGAVSTSWQPVLSNTTQSITVDLSNKPFTIVKALSFDFAQAPPQNLTVILHNYSSPDSGEQRTIISIPSVEISTPYNAANAAAVEPYSSNSSTYMLNQTVYSGNYATLRIFGNQADPSGNPTGATIAEFAVVGSCA